MTALQLAPSATNTDLLQPAFDIAMTLVRDALWHDKRCNWIGSWMDYIEGALVVATRTFGPDLYGGTSGIAVFLASMLTIEPDPLLRKTGDGAMAQSLAASNSLGRHGFHSGAPGLASVCLRCGDMLHREDWVRVGLEILESLPAPQEHEIDVIGGAAGTIPVLVHAATRDQPQLRSKAIELGDFLLRIAVRDSAGWSWPTVPATRNPTGFSHGTAGIGLALFELHHATHEARFLEAAEGAFAYEQSFFDPQQGNWPDFRNGTGVDATTGAVFGMSWCHGAPGIALSRLRAHRLTQRTDYLDQAREGLRTTRADTAGRLQLGMEHSNFSLCHGLAGNADILLESQQQEHVQTAIAVGLAGIENFEHPRLPWPSGVPGREPTPGLMMGIAGTGYFYLRLYDPMRFGTLLCPS